MSDVLVKILLDANQAQRQLEQQVQLVDQYGRAIESTSRKLPALSSASNTTGSRISGLGLQTNRANIALLDLSRIVEDSAFGIRGIANNIAPAILSFQRLQQEAGGVGGAIRGLLGAFRGPTGLISIIALATTTWITFGDQIAEAFTKAGDSARENEDDILSVVNGLLSVGSPGARNVDPERIASFRQELVDANDNIRQSLNALNAARATGQQLSGDLLARETALRDQLNDNLLIIDRLNELEREANRNARIEAALDAAGIPRKEKLLKLTREQRDALREQEKAFKEVNAEILKLIELDELLSTQFANETVPAIGLVEAKTRELTAAEKELQDAIARRGLLAPDPVGEQADETTESLNKTERAALASAQVFANAWGSALSNTNQGILQMASNIQAIITIFNPLAGGIFGIVSGLFGGLFGGGGGGGGSRVSSGTFLGRRSDPNFRRGGPGVTGGLIAGGAGIGAGGRIPPSLLSQGINIHVVGLLEGENIRIAVDEARRRRDR